MRRALLLGLLAIILVAAIGLRFRGLSWGLRHPPHTDEQDYVENVVSMLEAGDLDHRFYRYPAGFFYLLAVPLHFLSPDRWRGPDAYYVSRAVVSAFGVLNVLLLYFVGRRLLDPAAALVAAALLAMSPLDVMTSHQVRPDIVLETFGIVALLAFSSLGDGRRDLRAGCLIGAATAIKFTGLLMVPYYLAARLLAPRRALWGLALALLLTILIPIACTPYALIHSTRYAAGPNEQLHMYYQGSALTRFAQYLLYYLKDHRDALGSIGAWSAVAGAVYWLRRDPRTWGPRLLHPAVNLVVLATAILVFPRLILPAIGVVLLLAAAPVGVLLSRRDRPSQIGGVVLAVLMLVEPMRASWRYVERVAKPSAEDEALDWVDAIAAPGSRILETRLAANPGATPGCALGIDRSRFVFIERTRPEDQPDLRLLVPEMDYVITGDGRRRDPADMVEPVFVPKGPGCGEALRIERPLATAKPRYVPVDLALASVSASENAAALPALVDDRGETVWSTSGTAAPPEWIEIQLADAIQLGYLALEFPDKNLAGGKMSVLVAERGRDFRPVRRIAELASSASRQLKRPNVAPPRPFERRFILRDRSLVHAVRIERRAARGESWTLGGLRLAALASGG